MPEATDSNLQALNYVRMFMRRKEFLIVGAILGLALGICAGNVMPPQYRSSTVILVEEGKTDNPLFDKLAVSTTVQDRLSNIKESMLGWYSMVELVKRLNLHNDIRSAQEFESLVLGIRDRILIVLRGANVLALSYVGDDPRETQAVVENITDIFIKRNKEIQNQETADAIKFIEEQLKVYKGKIKSAEIAELQDKLDELLIDSTDMHPLVKQLRERIDIKMKELEKEKLAFTKADDLAKESNKSIIENIQKALSGIEQEAALDANKELYKFVLADKIGDVVARDAQVNESIYNVLLQRLETAKITQSLQTSKEGTRYTIVDPPRVPLAPFKPNKGMLAGGAAVAGLLLGAGIVFLIEFFDKSFIDVEDAKDFFGSPLLGAISRITTKEELSFQKEFVRWVYVIAIIASTVLVLSSMTIGNFLK